MWKALYLVRMRGGLWHLGPRSCAQQNGHVGWGRGGGWRPPGPPAPKTAETRVVRVDTPILAARSQHQLSVIPASSARRLGSFPARMSAPDLGWGWVAPTLRTPNTFTTSPLNHSIAPTGPSFSARRFSCRAPPPLQCRTGRRSSRGR